MKCTDLLVQEHKIILRALEVLDYMASRIEQDQPTAAQDVETLLSFLRAFADAQHQTKEESALFPELMRSAAGNDGAVRQMIFEHDRERSLVNGLEDALRTKKGMDFVAFAARLTGLIRAHIKEEDNVLFELAERSFSQAQDDRITIELNNFQIDPVLLADLRRLEWTYLRRVA